MSTELQPYKCECGHVIPPDGVVMHDSFSEIPGVRRLMPGNALCPACKQPIPFDCDTAAIAEAKRK